MFKRIIKAWKNRRKPQAKSKILVNTSYIQNLKPCQDRFDNWTAHYLGWRGNLSDFLELTHITSADKCWVFFRSIDIKTIPLVSADIAELTLANYEKAYPGDKRVRAAIEAARTPGISAKAADSAAYSAYSAAYSAASSAASSAAYSAAYSASSAAYSAANEAEQIKIMTRYC
jgi:hypothetical protein